METATKILKSLYPQFSDAIDSLENEDQVAGFWACISLTNHVVCLCKKEKTYTVYLTGGVRHYDHSRSDYGNGNVITVIKALRTASGTVNGLVCLGLWKAKEMADRIWGGSSRETCRYFQNVTKARALEICGYIDRAGANCVIETD